jgi:hypothetical protein
MSNSCGVGNTNVLCMITGGWHVTSHLSDFKWTGQLVYNWEVCEHYIGLGKVEELNGPLTHDTQIPKALMIPKS